MQCAGHDGGYGRMWTCAREGVGQEEDFKKAAGVWGDEQDANRFPSNDSMRCAENRLTAAA